MGRLTRSDWAVALLAAPVAVLAIVWLAVLGAERAGHPPLFGLTPRNLAEAAAFRDGAAIVRRVAMGEDPAAPGEVRAGFISSDAATVTPIEAASRASREEIVRLLLDLGTTVDPATWTEAWCSTESPEVRAELTRIRPGATAACE